MGKRKKSLEHDYLGCAKCGKTVETTIDSNYNKTLPEGWTRRMLDYHTTFCYCDMCSKKLQEV